MNGNTQLQHKHRKTMLFISFDSFGFFSSNVIQDGRFSEVVQRSNPRYGLRNTEKDPASFGQQYGDICRKGGNTVKE